MNAQIQQDTVKSLRRSSGFSGFFSFATLLLLVLAQNPDWGSSSLLWWGSVAFFLLTFFFSHHGVLSLERNYTIWLLAFTALCGLSIFWAVKSSLVITVMKSLIVHTVVLLVLRSAVRGKKDVEQLLKLVLLSIVINIVWLLLTNVSMFEATGDVIDRLGTEGEWNANNVGMMSAIAMLVALYFRNKATTKAQSWLLFGVIALTILVALLSGSRKALAMVLLGLCLFVFVTSKGKRIRAMLLVGAILLGIYYLVIEVPFFYSVMGWRVEGFFAALTGIGEADSSALIRDKFVTDAVQAWFDRPILGCGVDCYRAVNTVQRGMYAHNNYVELLADLGIVGAVSYYSAHVYCFVKMWKVKPKNNLMWLLLVALFVLLVTDYGCVSYNSLLDKILIMLMFSAASVDRKEKSVTMLNKH